MSGKGRSSSVSAVVRGSLEGMCDGLYNACGAVVLVGLQV